MKITILSLIFSFSIVPCIAQGIFIQSNFGLGPSAVYNRENSKRVDYTDLKMSTTLTPQGSLFVGYQFGKNNMSLSSIKTGVSYTPIRQIYKGKRTVGTYDLDLEAQTRLNYIQVPLLIEFALNQGKKTRPILQFGASYNHLLSYSTSYLSTPYPYFWEVKNNDEERYYTYTDNTRGGEYTGELSDWLYKNSTINLHAGIGVVKTISNGLDLSVLLNGFRSISGDIENKSEITFTREFKDGTIEIDKFNYFDSFISFTTIREDDVPKRANTFTGALGLQVGLVIKLQNTNNSIFKN